MPKVVGTRALDSFLISWVKKRSWVFPHGVAHEQHATQSIATEERDRTDRRHTQFEALLRPGLCHPGDKGKCSEVGNGNGHSHAPKTSEPGDNTMAQALRSGDFDQLAALSRIRNSPVANSTSVRHILSAIGSLSVHPIENIPQPGSHLCKSSSCPCLPTR